jgi:hypothetical protein
MNVRRRNGGVPKSHAQLMQIGDDVPGRVKSLHGCSLMVVNDEITRLIA